MNSLPTGWRKHWVSELPDVARYAHQQRSNHGENRMTFKSLQAEIDQLENPPSFAHPSSLGLKPSRQELTTGGSW